MELRKKTKSGFRYLTMALFGSLWRGEREERAWEGGTRKYTRK